MNTTAPSGNHIMTMTNADWSGLLELAIHHGWEPAGTQAPRLVRHPHTREQHQRGVTLLSNAAPALSVDKWENRAALETAAARSTDTAPWDGAYCVNAFQRVTAEDAANLARALTVALPSCTEAQCSLALGLIALLQTGACTIS